MAMRKPQIDFHSGLRTAQIVFAFLNMCLAAAMIHQTDHGEDIYTLIVALISMAFSGVLLANLLPLEDGHKWQCITHTVLEAVFNLLWFGAFLASCIAHAKDKKHPTGKALIAFTLIIWLTHLGSTFLVAKQMQMLMRYDHNRATNTDAEQLAGYHQDQSQHYQGERKSSADTGRESWMTRESMDSVKYYNTEPPAHPQQPYLSTV